MAVEATKLNFDPDELGKKYQQERDKRLRADGNEQYQEVKGDFAYFVDDPYIDNELQRDALESEVEVVIIGGGFGGMLAAARLREAGIDDFQDNRKGRRFWWHLVLEQVPRSIMRHRILCVLSFT